MSDQQATRIGVVLDLEDLFLSREFGRRPARLVSTAPSTVLSESAQLEELFLAEAFGHPGLAATAARVVEETAPAVAGRPPLVLLRGGRDDGLGRETTHHRAIAAVSGVAAAALAVAGLASSTGHGPGRSPVTEQAQGAPNQAQPGSGGSQPVPAASTVLPGPPSAGAPGAATEGGGANAANAANAALTSLTTPVPGATGSGSGATTPSAPLPPGGGSSPGTPPGGGGGSGSGTSLLTPTLNAVANEVSSVGSSVSTTTGDVGQPPPVAPVLQAVRPVATSAVNNLGGGTPPNILGVSNSK